MYYIILILIDFGALELLRENVTLNNCQQNCSVHFIEWGNKQLPESILSKWSSSLNTGKNIVIGSDLLYCSGVVRPLFETVRLLCGGDVYFILSTSFDIGVDVEKVVKECCLEFRILAIEVCSLGKDMCRLQYFLSLPI